MQGHALPDFYHERSHFQSRGDSYRLQGVGKARGCNLSFRHGRSWFRALDQLFDFATNDKDEIFKYSHLKF